ncbi:MAG TPA: methyltransferase domain-containing protein [Pseudonocardiaceae bacterium]|nr:methyltransferase domain-containing protein [Pseudonocardiaceae bacterium]
MTDTSRDWERRADVLAAEAIAEGRPTAWFDRLYSAGRRGDVTMPWDRQDPNQRIVEWAARRQIRGDGRRAVVVGCGLGRDAEFVSGLGFDTTAFDIAESAVQVVLSRYPDSPVHYRVADLFDPPAEWVRAFDLVVESYTVQALPVTLRERATRAVRNLVAPGGTLLFISNIQPDDAPPAQGPPWPLTRAQVEAFGQDGLVAVEIGESDRGWRAEFRRA